MMIRFRHNEDLENECILIDIKDENGNVWISFGGYNYIILHNKEANSGKEIMALTNYRCIVGLPMTSKTLKLQNE